VLLVVGVAVRAYQSRGALLYPDGYQYLLMARGYGLHLRPVIQLGVGGEHWVPNADASLKPLFPALVALVHLLGAGWLTAARLLTVASAGAAACLVGVLGARLSGSQWIGLGAALLVLLDPSMRYWAAFSSPDALGQALALGAILAVLSRRPRLAGVLTGLAAFARPELGLLLLAGGGAVALRKEHRSEAIAFLTTTMVTAAVVLVALRPPIEVRPLAFGAAAVGAAAAAAFALYVRPIVGVMVAFAILLFIAVDSPAARHLGVHDAAVVLVGLVGVVLARKTRPAAVLAVGAAALAVLYDAKNGTNTRYMSELVPFAALGAALGAGTVSAPRLRVAALAAGAVAVAGAAVVGTGALPGKDMFDSVAARLPVTKTPIATAASDAYGFLLYPRPVETLGQTSHGLILLDGSARAFATDVTVRGRVLAKLAAGSGFVRPDGELDRKPALLVEGEAVTIRG
jgi:hypothetical protein